MKKNEVLVSIRTSNQHRISFACAVIVEMMSEFEKKTKQV
jgi:hypothetical protein